MKPTDYGIANLKSPDFFFGIENIMNHAILVLMRHFQHLLLITQNEQESQRIPFIITEICSETA
jgi:hypothetical protein